MASNQAITSAQKQPAAARNMGTSNGSVNWGESDLVAAAKAGHGPSFDALWQGHATKILATTQRITRNREDAADAFQDALLNAFLHIQDFDGRATFSIWLTRIAINSALMILRKRRAAAELSIDDPAIHESPSEFNHLADPTPTPEVQYAQAERGAILLDAIRRLRPAMREAVELQKLQQRSLKETADMMGVSVVATKARLHHAKTELRGSVRLKAIRDARPSRQFHLPPAA